MGGLLFGLAGSRAFASEPQPPGLNWIRLEGAETCLSSAELAARVEARVGRVLFAPASEAGVFVDGHVRRDPDGAFRVALELSNPQGDVLGRRELRFEGAECSVIDEAVTLVIAVTLYPNTGLIEGGIPLDPSTAASLQALFGREPVDPDPTNLPSPSPEPEPAPPANAAAATSSPPVDGAAPRSDGVAGTRAERFRFGMDAAGTGGAGQLPGLNAGLTGHLFVAPPSAWPIEAGVALFAPASVHLDGVPGRAQFELMTASLAVCPWQPAWLRGLALCAGAEVGRLRVNSRGFASGDLRSSDATASALGVAVWRAQLTDALYLRSALLLAVPFAQRRYTVDTRDDPRATLYRMPQLAARLELGLGVRL